MYGANISRPLDEANERKKLGKTKSFINLFLLVQSQNAEGVRNQNLCGNLFG